MNSERPLVSVVIPAYNAEQFIERTLISVLDQTYCHLEIIVVDDGSCDRTPDIVRSLMNQDRRIALFQQPNQGVAAARNLAIQKANGTFIAPLDADDIWYPNNIEKQLRTIQNAGPKIGVTYAWSFDIDHHDHRLEGFRAANISGNVYLTLIGHNFLGNASASLIRRECFDIVGGYDNSFKAQNAGGCEDWDLYLRIAEKFHFTAVPEFLIGYRRTLDSMSSSNSLTMGASHNLMLKKVQQTHPSISNYLFRLSKSSFYLYLSQQSRNYQDYQMSLHWLGKSLQENLLVSLCRFGVYTLIIQNLIGSLLVSSPQKVTGTQKISNISINSHSFQWRLKFKLFISQVFHISRICFVQRKVLMFHWVKPVIVMKDYVTLKLSNQFQRSKSQLLMYFSR
ncbi:glycosyl transferase [Leptolyngbya sp. PCC 7375]|nr:glycosyl transferase [Leptolyngbya sp. PCC 7375]